MSSCMALVRFPDGAVKVTEYHGTSDILHAYLADTLEEWKAQSTWAAVVDVPWYSVPVDIWTNYGGGWWWQGRATRQWVVDGLCPHGAEGSDGEVIHPPLECHDGIPDWVWAWLDEHHPDTAMWERRLIAARTRA